MNLVKAAITLREFPQLSLMPERQFERFLSDRGLDVWVEWIRLLVRLGLIEPLGEREESFHPFQIWPISRLFRSLETSPSVWIRLQCLDRSESEGAATAILTERNKTLMDFPKSEVCLDFNQKLLPLLLWLESRFVPIVRGPRPNVIQFSAWDSSDWLEWKSSLQLADLLDRHSITTEDLKRWREIILLDAYQWDPSPELYLLLRSIPYDVRDRRLRGSLKLAYDLYELAEIIRLCLEQLSSDPVSKEWDPTGYPGTVWVDNLYGSQPAFGDPKFLRPLIRDFGIDPAYRVTWLVEGDTEEGFILGYAQGLGARLETYVSIRNFGGDGAFTKQLDAIDSDLESAKEEQSFVTLTFDESCGARERLEGLLEMGLVNFPYVLGKPDFELDNFTVEQLVSVALNWASDLNQSVGQSTSKLVQLVSDSN